MLQPCLTVPLDVIQKMELGLVRSSRLHTVVFDNRLESLSILFKQPITNLTTPISCMDIDRTENAFLLCGGTTGRIYLSNLYFSDFYGGQRKEDFLLPPSFRHNHFVSSCQWFNDIRLFVSVSSGGDLKAWDLANLSALETYHFCDEGKYRPQLHWNEIEKKNPLIAVTNGANQVPLFDLRIGDISQTLRSQDASVIGAVRWLPSKHHILFSGNNEGVLSVWDIRSNRRTLFSRKMEKGSRIRALRFTSDGLFLVLVLHTGAVILCDAVTMERLSVFELRDLKEWHGKLSSAFDQFAISDEGSFVWVSVPSGEDIAWFKFFKGPSEETSVFEGAKLCGHLSRVNACVYRRGTQQLYSAGADRNVLCWAPKCERDRLQLETETSRAVLSSDWSDDD